MFTREPVPYIYLRNPTYTWLGQLLKRDMVCTTHIILLRFPAACFINQRSLVSSAAHHMLQYFGLDFKPSFPLHDLVRKIEG